MKQATTTLPAERVIAPYAKAVDNEAQPEFAAVMHGIDLTRPLTDDEVSAIHAAIDRYGVLVFRDQHLDDALGGECCRCLLHGSFWRVGTREGTSCQRELQPGASG